MASGVSIPITLVDQVSGDLGAIRAKFDGLGKASTQVKLGVGIGAGVAGFNLASAAIGNVVDALGGMVTAAAEDEASQIKLTTALKANVKGWDGNTASIEKVLAARMKLGFSDDEQRGSLAILVAKTGDVSKALDIQSAAMDLARLKGISLGEASKAIALGMSGSGRALKELGINVKDLTDKEEVLGIIQEKAGGQAKAYADTTAGAMEAANVAIGEVAETIGTELLPYVKDLAIVLRDDGIPAAKGLGEIIGWLPRVIDPLGTAMGDAKKKIAEYEAAQKELAKSQSNSSPIAHTYAERLDSIGDKAAYAIPLAEGLAGASWDVRDAAKAAAKALAEVDTAYDKLNANIEDETAYETLPDRITVANGDIKTAQKELNAAIKAGDKVAIAAAKIRLAEAEAALRKLRLEWNKLHTAIGKNVTVGSISGTGRGGNRGTGPVPTALGGPVMAGVPLLVGEVGPELFVPGSSGNVIPNSALKAQGGTAVGGSTSITVNVSYSTGLSTATPGEMDRAARVLGPAIVRELRSRGLIAAGTY